jgi:hypothetical protein
MQGRYKKSKNDQLIKNNLKNPSKSGWTHQILNLIHETRIAYEKQTKKPIKFNFQ